jgi:hypothetical protein
MGRRGRGAWRGGRGLGAVAASPALGQILLWLGRLGLGRFGLLLLRDDDDGKGFERLAQHAFTRGKEERDGADQDVKDQGDGGVDA